MHEWKIPILHTFVIKHVKDCAEVWFVVLLSALKISQIMHAKIRGFDKRSTIVFLLWLIGFKVCTGVCREWLKDVLRRGVAFAASADYTGCWQRICTRWVLVDAAGHSFRQRKHSELREVWCWRAIKGSCCNEPVPTVTMATPPGEHRRRDRWTRSPDCLSWLLGTVVHCVTRLPSSWSGEMFRTSVAAAGSVICTHWLPWNVCRFSCGRSSDAMRGAFVVDCGLAMWCETGPFVDRWSGWPGGTTGHLCDRVRMKTITKIIVIIQLQKRKQVIYPLQRDKMTA